ncbi:hypothetical protein HanRHA438_Chr06g0284191 [Helianthus annuus]|uniref:Uncharacterized protein n=1 Tax=Helianthus annuus TaxID=4232 RepID=A0A251UVZ2_HELAN|nr:hypothetical protein HanXRQr2_Chr06g0275121 [Helianthus annuus]KAJ0568393.1 hypothetical protein HanIR_Chr06g0295741 [Helianthus annuus]KAJ0913308.1 hypothetical protein HanRHA438_Chr06g0284191 [Helianthus annuus]KAJ0916793.1 hypothetical protein HanPSC8_Chr06g0265951 [Helianthus annuus]
MDAKNVCADARVKRLIEFTWLRISKLLRQGIKTGQDFDPRQVHFGCRKTIKLDEGPNTI